MKPTKPIAGVLSRMAKLPWATIFFSLFMIVSIAVFADEAMARSGGSGGGGGFSRGGGGFGGGGGGGFGGGGIMFCGYMSPSTILIIFAVLAFFSFIQWLGKRNADKAAVYRVRFGITQPGDRPWEELEAMVRRASFDSPDGLASFVRNIALYLRRKGGKITHASMVGVPKLGPSEAEQKFQALTSEARASFEREVLRIEGNQRKLLEQKREGKTDGLTDEDGSFGINEFFVVTLVVGIDHSGPTLPEKIGGPQDLDAVLAALGAVGSPMVLAAEVVWTPASESDILPVDEATMTFPDLMELR